MYRRLVLSAIALCLLSEGALAAMKLTSNDMTSGGTLDAGHVLNGFGCEGGNISPHLQWTGAPEGTESYVVMAYDPDAPTGSGWWHWTAFNLPADSFELVSGASGDDALLPHGAIEGRTDFGTPGYGGACPPEGDAPHRYRFTVYALGIAELPLDETASGAMVGFFARANALEEATIEVTYGR